MQIEIDEESAAERVRKLDEQIVRLQRQIAELTEKRDQAQRYVDRARAGNPVIVNWPSR